MKEFIELVAAMRSLQKVCENGCMSFTFKKKKEVEQQVDEMLEKLMETKGTEQKKLF